MFEKNRDSLISLSRHMIVFVIVVFCAWFILQQAQGVQAQALDAHKKLELRQLYAAISTYQINTGDLPHNPNNPEWCEIGDMYNQKICLEELLGNQYFDEVLPFSPDDSGYMYFKGPKEALVAVQLGSTYDTNENDCSIQGSEAWCLAVQRN